MSQRQPSSLSLLEQTLLGAVALALVAMLSLPAARGLSDAFGWMPFWLLALPLSAWAVARALRQRRQGRRAPPMATVHPIRVAHSVRSREAMLRAA